MIENDFRRSFCLSLPLFQKKAHSFGFSSYIVQLLIIPVPLWLLLFCNLWYPASKYIWGGFYKHATNEFFHHSVEWSYWVSSIGTTWHEKMEILFNSLLLYTRYYLCVCVNCVFHLFWFQQSLCFPVTFLSQCCETIWKSESLLQIDDWSVVWFFTIIITPLLW